MAAHYAIPSDWVQSPSLGIKVPPHWQTLVRGPATVNLPGIEGPQKIYEYPDIGEIIGTPGSVPTIVNLDNRFSPSFLLLVPSPPVPPQAIMMPPIPGSAIWPGLIRGVEGGLIVGGTIIAVDTLITAGTTASRAYQLLKALHDAINMMAAKSTSLWQLFWGATNAFNEATIVCAGLDYETDDWLECQNCLENLRTVYTAIANLHEEFRNAISWATKLFKDFYSDWKNGFIDAILENAQNIANLLTIMAIEYKRMEGSLGALGDTLQNIFTGRCSPYTRPQNTDQTPSFTPDIPAGPIPISVSARVTLNAPTYPPLSHEFFMYEQHPTFEFPEAERFDVAGKFTILQEGIGTKGEDIVGLYNRTLTAILNFS